jgi:hypothetical protein
MPAAGELDNLLRWSNDRRLSNYVVPNSEVQYATLDILYLRPV